jgi:hypothetical protein
LLDVTLIETHPILLCLFCLTVNSSLMFHLPFRVPLSRLKALL